MGDPVERLRNVAARCQADLGMQPAGPPEQGRQGEAEAAQTKTIRVEGGRCYRIVLAHEASIQNAVVLVRDSSGVGVVESPTMAVPSDRAMCFAESDTITLVVSVGRGAGAYATQLCVD